MIQIDDKKECCGCYACYSACPVKCIEMKNDEEGFAYPSVDVSRCINCNKCVNVCPIKNLPKVDLEYDRKGYYARSKDIEILKVATSGGVFSSLSSAVIDDGGCAVGAAFDRNLCLKHIAISSLNDLYQLSGSKYIQSEIGDVFIRTKDYLKEGKKVIFCGTPCQVAGLVNYLGEDYENLFLIDLVCHGVPSQKVFDHFVQESSNSKKLVSVNFRSKRYGYHFPVMEETFSCGSSRYNSGRLNTLLRTYFANIADRESCYDCVYKQMERCSDITLFDGWSASSLVEDIKEDDLGYTAVIVQSEKGRKLLEEYGKDIELYDFSVQKMVEKDGNMMLNYIVRPKNRDLFYRYLDDKGLKGTLKSFGISHNYDVLVELFKKITYKYGILSYLKALRKR